MFSRVMVQPMVLGTGVLSGAPVEGTWKLHG
jgi:hypothetical protein